MGEMSGFQLGVVGALFLSVASSVSIVIVNKALMSNLGFPFGKFHIWIFLGFFFVLVKLIYGWIFVFLTNSNNIDKLAPNGNILYTTCGTSLQLLWKQANWYQDCYAFWHSKWCFYWFPQLKSWFQLYWLLSGHLLTHYLTHLSIHASFILFYFFLRFTRAINHKRH